MNYNNILKIFGLLMLVFISSCAKNIEAKLYSYIEIKECIIPIDDSLYMKDGNDTSKEYLFVSKKEYTFKDYRLDRQVDVLVPRNKSDIIKFKNDLQKVHSESLGYLKSIDVRKNVKIWYFQEKINDVKLNLFSYIFLKNTVIVLTNHNKLEIKNIIDYCELHQNRKTKNEE